MTRDTDGIIQEKFAASGDVGLGDLVIDDGWPIAYSTPGGKNPQRLQFNQLYRNLFALAVEINQKGPFLEYDNTVDYAIGAAIRASDGKYYQALAANGPATAVVSPIGNPATWFDMFSALGISFDDSNVSFTAATVQEAIEQLPTQPNLISGLVGVNGVDADHDITISTGICRDSANTTTLSLSAALTKQIDSVWAVGDAAGGLFTGVVANDTWYHLFLIRKDSDGSIDAGFDTSVVAVNIPAGYTAFRRIGSVLTDGSANILPFHVTETPGGGINIDWDAAVLDLDGSWAVTRSLLTLSVPIGISTTAKIIGQVSGTVTVHWYWIKPTNLTDVAASASDFDLSTTADHGQAEIHKSIKADSSSQIAYRGSTVTGIRVVTQGYIDGRI